MRVGNEVIEFIDKYIKKYPCSYVDELRRSIKKQFPNLEKEVKTNTLLRILKIDLKLSRKVIEKRAMEAVPKELNDYYVKLRMYYTSPHQLVFVDETSKDGRCAYRRKGWSIRGKKCLKYVPFSRGNRISVLASCDANGFMSMGTTEGTFNRHRFHEVFCQTIVPLLNPYPLRRSIVVIDNARIHIYEGLETVIHEKGALLFFLPPYSPHLNPIEVLFGLLKRWIQKEASNTFHMYPKEILKVGIKECLKETSKGVNIYHHCGYEKNVISTIDVSSTKGRDTRNGK